MAIRDPRHLLDSLRALPRETEWLEFKLRRFDPEKVGQYISGLANAAILHEQERAYLVFGVANVTHDVVGTDVRLKSKRVGGDIFEHWLARMLHPKILCEFVSIDSDGKRVEMIIIDPAYISPVRFKTEAFIRVDSVHKRLHEFPERERVIWALTSRRTFERGMAATHLGADELFE